MASSIRNWRYNVFTSFHGPDVRKTFLSHLRKQFSFNGISMFNDQGIERGETIAPALTQAIRESRISIVVLSEKYASSSWCLDELVEIFKCKEDLGQILMTVFYGVDPSDVRKQKGDFGSVFNETCASKTEEERQKWSQALTDAGNIAGYDFLTWDNEAKMIEKIAKDVSEKLHDTPSKDFDGMVGLEAHLRRMESLLRLRENLDATPSMIVGICGPAGIGKSTIARALHNLHSNKFQLTCFVDNLRGSYPGVLNEYSLKLILQAELLSKIFNLKDITINHLGVIQERLHDKRVLIILDDVNHIMQLEALANETTWFGPGSRIVVTTENKELLQQHGINNMYHVGFPSDLEAIEILCRYAFKQSYPRNGFIELVGRVTELCGRLPLGLQVVGSSLRGKNEEEWKRAIHRLDTILDHRDIEEVLRVGYESLHENEKSLFVHIAVFFNYYAIDMVEALFVENNNNLDTKNGLKFLENRSLIDVSTSGHIVMHKLLQRVGTNAARRGEAGKRKILMDAQDIRDSLEDEDANSSKQVSGILFDISGMKEVFINKRAFKRMTNLRFLKVMKSKDDENDIVHIPEGMDFPLRLRFFDWQAYPGKAFPGEFKVECLVELNLQYTKLEKLWEGTQLLKNLKKMNLVGSRNLKELPNLTYATSLEFLVMRHCDSLVELPSSMKNLHRLTQLDMRACSQLRKVQEISINIKQLMIADTMLEELPWLQCLETLVIFGIQHTNEIKKLPNWIKHLHGLEELYISGCPKLASLPELPSSLRRLRVHNCESLETLTSFPFDSQIEELNFSNCIKLGQEAQRIITEHLSLACFLPGRTLPVEFVHRAKGDWLTFRSRSKKFKIGALVSPKLQTKEWYTLYLGIFINGCFNDQQGMDIRINTEHVLLVFVHICELDGCLEQDNEISFGFFNPSEDIDVIECGVRNLTGSTSSDGSDASSSDTTTSQRKEKMAESLMEKATSALDQAKETVTASTESAKPASTETPKTDTMRDVVDNVVTRGIDGAKSLLHNLEEKKDEVSSTIMGAVSHYTGSADSTAANHDLPVSSDNQPLLAGDREAEPWWKKCCEVIDLLKTSSSAK